MMTPMPLDTTAEPPVENKIDLGLGGHNARDQPEGEEDGTRLDAAHTPLVLAAVQHSSSSVLRMEIDFMAPLKLSPRRH